MNTASRMGRIPTRPPTTRHRFGTFTCGSLGVGDTDQWICDLPIWSGTAFRYSISSMKALRGCFARGQLLLGHLPREGSILLGAFLLGDTPSSPSTSYKVDTEPPPGQFAGRNGSNGWYRTSMVITPRCITIANLGRRTSTQVCIDGTCAPTGTLSEGTIPFCCRPGCGWNTAQSGPFFNSGGSDSASICCAACPDGQNGWFRSAVVLEPGASDGVSGVADQQICMDGSCGSSVTLSEGIHTNHSHRSIPPGTAPSDGR